MLVVHQDMVRLVASCFAWVHPACANECLCMLLILDLHEIDSMLGLIVSAMVDDVLDTLS